MRTLLTYLIVLCVLGIQYTTGQTSGCGGITEEEMKLIFNSGECGGSVSWKKVTGDDGNQYYEITTNDLPDHTWGCVNPNAPRSQGNGVFTIPVCPKKLEEPNCVPPGPNAISRSGVHLYNALNAFGLNAVEGSTAETMDCCGGHADPFDNYHYHALPDTNCMVKSFDDGSGRVFLGVAFDGYPIYKDINVADKDLDECHGIEVNGRYEYIANGKYPYMMGCFKGDVSHQLKPHQLKSCDGMAHGTLCDCRWGLVLDSTKYPTKPKRAMTMSEELHAYLDSHHQDRQARPKFNELQWLNSLPSCYNNTCDRTDNFSGFDFTSKDGVSCTRVP